MAALSLVLAGCTKQSERVACSRDGECPSGQVCLPDDLCLPADVAARTGNDVGKECRVESGTEVGCADENYICRLGRCEGPGGLTPQSGPECTGTAANSAPLFGGATASPDGATAAVIRWAPAADETPHAQLRYRLYMTEGAGKFDLESPVATLIGQVQFRQDGLTEGRTYHFLVRAVDEAGQSECNTKVASVTPRGLGDCVDYVSAVKPILDAHCVRCHSGANPPQGLKLDTLEGVFAGGRTGNEVVRCKSESSLLFQKISMATPPVGARMPFDGPPYLSDFQIETIRRWIASGASASCAAPSQVCSDATPPSFAGVTSATLETGGTAAKVCWSPATDEGTPAGELLYDLYQATTPGGQNYAGLPRLTTAAGATCATVDGLTPQQQFCFVARARDAAGNRDANTVERCVTTPAAACIDYATMVQPIFNARCVHCHSGATPPRNLRLDSYAGVKAGGLTGNEIVACRPADSLLHQKVSLDKPPVGARMPFDGPPYLSDAQIKVIQSWIAEGGRASCSETNPCNDSVPPTFAGATTVTATNATSAQVCWNPATDNLTPPSALLYDVYWSQISGGQSYTTPGQTSAPGASCTTVKALSPGERVCFVARARDGGGNRDSNVVERCITLPAVPAGCVDYAAHLQPLFEKNCTRCHTGPLAPQGLQLDTYAHAVAGSVRRKELRACDPDGSLLVQKIGAAPPIGKRMPFDGPPYLTTAQINLVRQWIANGAGETCTQPSNCGDAQPPSFGGIASAVAVDSTTARICWSPGSDNATPASALRYDLYEARTSGTQVFGEPAQHTAVNQGCQDVRMAPGTTLCFAVRARDLSGNADANTKELCVTTPTASCAVEYEPHIRPIVAARCNHCHGANNPPRFLDLTSYGKMLAGGALRREVRACDAAASLLFQKTSDAVCGRRMPFDGPPYLAPSQLSLLQHWLQSGAREKCSDASPCADSTPPSFFGAQSVQAVDATTARLCWSQATDNTTPASAIAYDVYEAAGSGNERLLSPASYSAAPGSLCVDIATPPGQSTCFIVRARDLHGNRDSNTTERCLTLPGACVDYQSRVQSLFDARCVHCHSGPNPPKGIRWDSYAHATANDREVSACKPLDSKLVRVVERCEMPYDTSSAACATPACLTPSQSRFLNTWISQGAGPSCPAPGCP